MQIYPTEKGDALVMIYDASSRLGETDFVARTEDIEHWKGAARGQGEAARAGGPGAEMHAEIEKAIRVALERAAVARARWGL